MNFRYQGDFEINMIFKSNLEFFYKSGFEKCSDMNVKKTSPSKRNIIFNY